jgi:hypothetical protein
LSMSNAVVKFFVSPLSSMVLMFALVQVVLMD